MICDDCHRTRLARHTTNIGLLIHQFLWAAWALHISSNPGTAHWLGPFLFDIGVNLRHLMDSINVSELVERLGSDEDAVRKMAVFKLQSNIGDPSFADVFILEGGLTKLRYLALHATGNTLAYSLTSFSRLLEVDKGWEYVNSDLVERVKHFPRVVRRLLTWT